jgi:hypothetical protein
VLASLLAVALVAAGPIPFERTCATRAETSRADESPRAGAVRLGRLAFAAHGVEQMARGVNGSDPTVKLPVALRIGPPVTVRLRRSARARLDFDNEESGSRRRRVASGDGQLAVRFEACPRGTRRFSDGRPHGRWTFYPGGFLVARAGCVSVTARGRGMRTARTRLALGVPLRRCR